MWLATIIGRGKTLIVDPVLDEIIPPKSILDVFADVAGSGRLIQSGVFPYVPYFFKLYEHTDVTNHTTYWLVIDGHVPGMVDIYDWCSFVTGAGSRLFMNKTGGLV